VLRKRRQLSQDKKRERKEHPSPLVGAAESRERPGGGRAPAWKSLRRHPPLQLSPTRGERACLRTFIDAAIRT
jgi:hypothetical protein